MEEYSINMFDDSKYIACVTVLDYEILLSRCLRKITFESSLKEKRFVLVDLALKSGIDEFRFVEFDVDKSGKIDLDSHQYVKVDFFFENVANHLLKEKKEIVLHSILTDSQKKKILNL